MKPSWSLYSYLVPLRTNPALDATNFRGHRSTYLDEVILKKNEVKRHHHTGNALPLLFWYPYEAGLFRAGFPRYSEYTQFRRNRFYSE